jgi:N-acetylmuramoyl-L-alanine amidase
VETQPINADCRLRYLRVPIDGDRPVSAVIGIVIHDTEGGTAEGIAKYFKTNTTGYTHLVVDDKECQRCLRDKAISRGARGANTRGFHIEQCGHASWSVAKWRQHIRMIRRSAYKTALHCHKFKIPPRWITARDLTAGRAGITSHAERSRRSVAATLILARAGRERSSCSSSATLTSSLESEGNVTTGK